MNLLVLTPEYLPTTGGGIVTFYRHLLPALVKRGHSVRVIHGSGSSAAISANPTLIDGVQTEALELHRIEAHAKRFSHLAAMPRLRTTLAAAWAMWEQTGEGAGADVIEACDFGLLFVPPVLASRSPVIAQCHGSIGQIETHDPIDGEEAQGVLIRLVEAAVLRRATAIQTYSRANADFWHKQTGADVQHISPAWQPLQRSDRQAELSSSGLVLGRVQQWKGPHVLCQALTQLGSRAPTIDWVGRDTVLRERTQSCSRQLGNEFPTVWGPRIRHLPQVPPAIAETLQRSAQFIVVPSTWDVFNFTCAEAMASGRPVICSTGAGASELIEHGINGFTFQNGDASSLASILDEVLGLDDRRRADIGRAGRATVEHTLDVEMIAERRLADYCRAAELGPPQLANDGDWLLEACSGRNAATPPLAFLDHQPLKPLIRYGFGRAAAKLTGPRRD